MPVKIRTQVGIIGAGPAGLLLAYMLRRAGINSVILEKRSRSYILGRVRAGVMEQATRDLLIELGLGDRLCRDGLLHKGFEIRFANERRRIDLSELTGGKVITVYGQQEVVKDLLAALEQENYPLHFEIDDVHLEGIDEGAPCIRGRGAEGPIEISCDFIAGCDGFYGVSRASIPDGVLSVLSREYPFAWLSILAEAPSASHELIYAHHQRGGAIYSMRNKRLSRHNLQCDPDGAAKSWPADKIWDELEVRLNADNSERLPRGPILDRVITRMRSFVVEPMQYGSLFLAGDAAHIVPPTGAKGINLAVADIKCLAAGFIEHYRAGRRDKLNAYSTICLARIWRVQRFSWWMTSMFHRFPDQDTFTAHMQIAELDHATGSQAAAASLAENYVGLPHSC